MRQWVPLHFRGKEDGKMSAHLVLTYEDAFQMTLEAALKMANRFIKNLDKPANDWEKYDWSVFNFRTKERIVVSAL